MNDKEELIWKFFDGNLSSKEKAEFDGLRKNSSEFNKLYQFYTKTKEHIEESEKQRVKNIVSSVLIPHAELPTYDGGIEGVGTVIAKVGLFVKIVIGTLALSSLILVLNAVEIINLKKILPINFTEKNLSGYDIADKYMNLVDSSDVKYAGIDSLGMVLKSPLKDGMKENLEEGIRRIKQRKPLEALIKLEDEKDLVIIYHISSKYVRWFILLANIQLENYAYALTVLRLEEKIFKYLLTEEQYYNLLRDLETAWSVKQEERRIDSNNIDENGISGFNIVDMYINIIEPEDINYKWFGRVFKDKRIKFDTISVERYMRKPLEKEIQKIKDRQTQGVLDALNDLAPRRYYRELLFSSIRVNPAAKHIYWYIILAHIQLENYTEAKTALIESERMYKNLLTKDIYMELLEDIERAERDKYSKKIM